MQLEADESLEFAPVAHVAPHSSTQPLRPAAAASPASVPAGSTSGSVRAILDSLEQFDTHTQLDAMSGILGYTQIQLMHKSRELENRAFKLQQEEDQILSLLRSVGLLPSLVSQMPPTATETVLAPVLGTGSE